MTRMITLGFVLGILVSCAGESEPASGSVDPLPNPDVDEAPPKPPGHESEPGRRLEIGEGLVITDIVIGDGTRAIKGARIKTQVKGMLASNGVEFWSSKPNDPFVTPLTRPPLIAGWVKGIPGMKVGGKRRLEIPWKLAYGIEGNRGAGIPPRADLIFEIVLINVF